MPRFATALAAALLLALALAHPARAQEETPRRVVLVDGTVLVGTVADETADPLVVITRDGVEQRVARARVREVAPLIRGRFYRLDPNRTRLFVTPTARTLGRGNGRLSTFFYIFPNLAYGVHDRIDLSAGAFFAFGGGGFALLNGNAKAQLLRTDAVQVAVGANAFLPVGSDVDGGVGGSFYGLATFGNEITAGTVGVLGLYGGDFTEGDFSVADGAVLLGGAEHQLTNGLKLLVEAGVPVGEGSSGVVAAPGVRLFGDQFAVDLYGVIGVADGEAGGFAPIVNFSYNF